MKRGQKGKADPVVVDVRPDDEEAALAIVEGGTVAQFVAGLKAFFSTARELESGAVKALEVARTWKQPGTLEEDERLVRSVRDVNTSKRTIEEHWSITSKVHQFHRRLTAARDRGVTALEEAAKIGNRLHAQYVEAEERRAREEAERRQRAEEERQRIERQQESDRLEAQALEMEATSPELSARERRFVEEFSRLRNGVAAAKLAGYRDFANAGVGLLGMPKILEAIGAIDKAEALRRQAAAVQAAPVEPSFIPESKPEVAKGAAITYSAEVFDVELFLSAVLDPVARTRHGIPVDVVTFDTKRMNEYARALQQNIGRWPGVRAKKGSSIR